MFKEVFSWYCIKPRYIQSQCYKEKPHQKKKDSDSSKNTDVAMIAILCKNHSEKQSSADTRQPAYVDLAGTTHVMRENYFQDDRKVTTNASIGTTGGGSQISKSEGTSDVRLSGETGMVKVNRLLYVPKIGNNVMYVAQLYDGGHTVLFDDKQCVVNRNDIVTGVDQRTENKYDLNVRIESKNQALATSIEEEDVLNLWHARLAHMDRHATTQISQKGVVRGLYMERRVKTATCTHAL